MRDIEDIYNDLKEIKEEMSIIENLYGTQSHEYTEIHEEFCSLIEEKVFGTLHG